MDLFYFLSRKSQVLIPVIAEHPLCICLIYLIVCHSWNCNHYKQIAWYPLGITAIGNISANGNLYFKVFKLQLKVINKNVCYLYSSE